jgi:hypothetical protein
LGWSTTGVSALDWDDRPMITFPVLSTAMHSDGDGHETPVTAAPLIAVFVQAGLVAFGLVETNAPPG